jgi:hypothetical protein
MMKEMILSAMHEVKAILRRLWNTEKTALNNEKAPLWGGALQMAIRLFFLSVTPL